MNDIVLPSPPSSTPSSSIWGSTSPTLGDKIVAQARPAAAAPVAAPVIPAGPPPTSAAEARAQRNVDMADKAFAAALDRGDVTARARWNAQRDLINGPDQSDAVSRAMSDEPPTAIIQDSADVEMRGIRDFYRERGFNNQQIEDVLSNKPHTQAEKDMAATSRQRQLNSREWQARLSAKEPDALFEFYRERAILRSPLKSE